MQTKTCNTETSPRCVGLLSVREARIWKQCYPRRGVNALRPSRRSSQRSPACLSLGECAGGAERVRALGAPTVRSSSLEKGMQAARVEEPQPTQTNQRGRQGRRGIQRRHFRAFAAHLGAPAARLISPAQVTCNVQVTSERPGLKGSFHLL